jgi:hypothetical protein
VSPPGRVPFTACAVPIDPCLIEHALGLGKSVIGSFKLGLSLLERGLGFGERVLGCFQPAGAAAAAAVRVTVRKGQD